MRACNSGLGISKMIDARDKEMFIKLSKTGKSKLVLLWLKDLAQNGTLTMEDVLELMKELKN